MKALARAKLCLLLLAAPAVARAQTVKPATDAPGADSQGADAVGAGLAEILSLATMGTVTPGDQTAHATPDNGGYAIRLPLSGFSSPPNAAIDAVARPAGNGMWDIPVLTLPSSGAFDMTMLRGEKRHIAYSIGEQAIQVSMDPSFAQNSTFKADIGHISLHSGQGDFHSEQTFGRYTSGGTLSLDSAGLLNMVSQGSVTNWHLTAKGPATPEISGTIGKGSGHAGIEGLDRIQGTRLLAAIRALSVSETAALRDPAGPTPAMVRDLRGVTDAAAGLLTKVSAEESLDDIRFTGGAVSGARIAHMRIGMMGDTARHNLTASMDIAADGLSMAGLSAELAAYLPRHLALKTSIAGMQIGPLLELLRAATAPGADPAALQPQLAALFAGGAQAGIESFAFDSGSLAVTGSARFMPQASRPMGTAVHISAIGLDALMARAQNDRSLQQILPMMFLAKGMGRQQGNAVVWDIVLGNGPVTVNGVPFGQPPASRR